MYSNVSAIVLSARRAGEKDKRLALYTLEAGRLTGVAVGAARPGAKLGAATETAVESRFRLWRVGGDAPSARVTGGGVENVFPGLRAHWERLAAAQTLCEWTERLTPLAEPHPEKYDLLHRALAHLEAADPVAVRLAFQARFLTLAGYNAVRDVPGLSGAAGAEALLGRMAAWDPAGPPPAVPAGFPAPYLNQQLLKFISPLLSRPLKAGAHEEELHRYREKAAP